MDFKYLLNLAGRAAKGYDDLKNGSVGYNGYGFVFRELKFPFSRKLFNFGSMGKFAQDLENDHSNDKGFQSYDVFQDILLVGSIKTLVPSLELGGDEILFNAWMFVATNDGRAFPTHVYYRTTRLAVGGWKFGESGWFDVDSQIPEEIYKITNCDPFKFSSIIKKEFVESLEYALKKVPPSDFYAIFEHDLGYRLMGISDGSPVSIELGESPTLFDVKSHIGEFFGIEANPRVFEKWDFH